MIEKNIRQKIEQLIARAKAIPQTTSGMAADRTQYNVCEAWLTEAMNVIQVAIPQPENAYRTKIDTLAKRTSKNSSVKSAELIFESLLSDIDAGLLGNLGDKIAAGLFDDFLDHAEAYVQLDRKMEAGVIAGVVFEDTVRRIHRENIADDKDKKLEDLINGLARHDIITGQQSKQAKVASHVRTKATHAQWDEFDLQGVADTIQITRLLLREHLGG
jgi:hypothetical protein